MEVEILPVGDMAMQILFQQPVSDSLHKQIQQTIHEINKNNIPGVQELVPGLQSITIYYNPLSITFEEIKSSIATICQSVQNEGDLSLKKVVIIPTCYDGAFGEDLERVASLHKLAVEEVISIHSSVDYLVYMIGFLPGFPYLKGLPEILHTPRLSTPRLKVPQGAVGIGGNQTGVYPLESPGGWNLIGKTPLRLFDSSQPSPFLLKNGDYIRFVPISSEEFYEIEVRVKKLEYQIERKVLPRE